LAARQFRLLIGWQSLFFPEQRMQLVTLKPI
jgi:hypothetical protein